MLFRSCAGGIAILPLNRPLLGYKRRGRPPHTTHTHSHLHILILSSPLHNVEPLHHTSTLQEYYGESRATLPSLARIVVRSERGARAEFLLRRTPGKLGFHGAECRTCRLPPHLYLYGVELLEVRSPCLSFGIIFSLLLVVCRYYTPCGFVVRPSDGGSSKRTPDKDGSS